MSPDLGTQIATALGGFGVKATPMDVKHGPRIDRHELIPAAGTKVATVTKLADDLAMALGVMHARVIAPIPGTKRIGVEVPAATPREVSTDDLGQIPDDHPLRFPVGLEASGAGTVHARFDRLPHLLVAGTTGSGKSVWMNTLLSWIVTHSTANEVRLVLIDPKRVELAPFAGVPHLAGPIACDTEEAIAALGEMVAAMEERYADLERRGMRKIDDIDVDERPPYTLVVIDELADLIMTGKSRVEEPLVRLLQMGRAAGIHCLLATQRPSADVLTGLIRTNAPSRLVFTVASHVDARVAGVPGAQNLAGQGDALWLPSGENEPIRVQAVVSHLELPARSLLVDDEPFEDVDLRPAQEQIAQAVSEIEQRYDWPRKLTIDPYDEGGDTVEATLMTLEEWNQIVGPPPPKPVEHDRAAWDAWVQGQKRDAYDAGYEQAKADLAPVPPRRMRWWHWLLAVAIFALLLPICGTISQFPIAGVIAAGYATYLILRQSLRRRER